VPSGNGSCLLLKRGRGGSVSDSKGMRPVVTDGMGGVNRGMDTEVVATLSIGPIVLVYDSSGNQLGAHRRAYGKRDVDGRPRVRLLSGNPATKGDESKTRENIEAETTATGKPKSRLLSPSTFHFGFIIVHTSHEIA